MFWKTFSVLINVKLLIINHLQNKIENFKKIRHKNIIIF